MGLLSQQRDRLGVGSDIPVGDANLDQKILSEAKTRSQEIRDAGALLAETVFPEPEKSVPLWLAVLGHCFTCSACSCLGGDERQLG